MATSDAPPNVLMICVDDMNPWFSCLEDRTFVHPQSDTPNLDALAAEGTLFANAHCPAPICNPSRTAVLTGLHPTSTGIYGNYCWWRPHLKSHPSLPEWFRRNGYHTVGTGKVFHHCIGFNPPDQWDDFRDYTFDDPWDRQSRVNYPHITPNEPPPGHPLSDLPVFYHEFDWGSLPIEEEAYGDSRSVAFTETFLQQDHQKPFFLACGLFHPHLPWYAPPRFFEAYENRSIQVPADLHPAEWQLLPEKGKALARVGPQDRDQLQVLRKNQRLPEAMGAYLANIRFTDHLAGRVLQALDSSPHSRNTIVVFWGDHGFHLGEKHHFGKQALWRESTQVPWILRGSTVPRGKVVDQPVSTLNLAASLADLAGLPPHPDWDSVSLAPSLLEDAPFPDQPVLCTFQKENHALITEDFRYIHYEDGGEELYVLNEDPRELHNRAADPDYEQALVTLRSLLPQSVAAEAPGIEAYDFDWRSYQWKERSSR